MCAARNAGRCWFALEGNTQPERGANSRLAPAGAGGGCLREAQWRRLVLQRAGGGWGETGLDHPVPLKLEPRFVNGLGVIGFAHPHHTVTLGVRALLTDDDLDFLADPQRKVRPNPQAAR